MYRCPVIPIILCGGTGSRLWPISRESYPKQYLKINPEDNLTLLQRTFKRISNVPELKDPILVCNEEHRFIAAEQMRQIGIIPQSILLEPFGKNTAPAITLAAITAIKNEEDPILIVLSSDHFIKDEAKFVKIIKNGINYAKKDRLVTFGVSPTKPETGYGYIKSAMPFKTEQIEGINIDKFIEKPDIDNARKFLEDKRFVWNSGIFAFKANILINEIKKFSKNIFETCNTALLNAENDLDFKRIKKEDFAKCQDISLDVAVMEKTNLGTVLNLDVGWSDIGNWNSVWENSSKDVNGNFYKGKVIHKNSKNCYFRSEDRLIVGLDLENTIVIETNDAILVSNKNSSESLKNIVKKLDQKNFKEGKFNKKMYRPWGSYTCLIESESWQVKILEIKPFASLSLQLHHYRSEHWVVVNGTAKVEIDGLESTLVKNQSIFVPLGLKHRLSNPKNIPLEIIEVQNGVYLGEDDIERFDDEYGRT